MMRHGVLRIPLVVADNRQVTERAERTEEGSDLVESRASDTNLSRRDKLLGCRYIHELDRRQMQWHICGPCCRELRDSRCHRRAQVVEDFIGRTVDQRLVESLDGQLQQLAANVRASTGQRFAYRRVFD